MAKQTELQQQLQQAQNLVNLAKKMRKSQRRYDATRSQLDHDSMLAAQETFDTAEQAYLEEKNPLVTVTVSPEASTAETGVKTGGE